MQLPPFFCVIFLVVVFGCLNEFFTWLANQSQEKDAQTNDDQEYVKRNIGQ